MAPVKAASRQSDPYASFPTPPARDPSGRAFLQPPSPTFERNKELFPRLSKAAYVSDIDDEDVAPRHRVRKYHSATTLRSSYQQQQQKEQQWDGYGSRRRTHSANSAPNTPPRMTKLRREAHTAPASPTRRSSRVRYDNAAPPLRKMPSMDSNWRTHLSRSPSSASDSSRRSTRSTNSTASSASSLMEDILPFGAGKRVLKLSLPDRTKAIARATEAFQFGLIAFGAALALWTLFAVLFASYGLTALDSFTSSTRWVAKYSPVRRRKPVVDAETSNVPQAPPRPPMSSLLPTLMFTLLVWGGDQAVAFGTRRSAAAANKH